MVKTIIKKIINKLKKPRNSYRTYAQGGEDIILNRFFESKGINKPTYLDIGASDPVKFSNTYFFYKKGARGVCIEPNHEIIKKFKRKRKHDQVLNIGIGVNDVQSADFYMMTWHEFNTFSKERAYKYQAYYKGRNNIEKIIKMPLVNINTILEQYFEKAPDLISIDVEGIDFEIIKTFNFSKYMPMAFCIESIDLSEENKHIKNTELAAFMEQKGYGLYADTYINYIFIDSAYL